MEIGVEATSAANALKNDGCVKSSIRARSRPCGLAHACQSNPGMDVVRILCLPILSLSLLALAPAASLDGQRDLVHTFLRDTMGFSASEVSAVDGGRAIARQMRTRDPVDVNIFGAVRIAAPVDVFIRQLRAIENYERRLGVLQVGKFRNPPQPADLAGLTLERDDLLDLASCRVGDCEIQLAGTDIERFRALNWRAVDVSAAANGAFRTMSDARTRGGATVRGAPGR